MRAEKEAQSARAKLATGLLEVRAEPGSARLEDMIDFAARSNPKRGFLFVSKVLGRHIPTRPSAIDAAQKELAARVAGRLGGGKAFVVGLAETAVGMAQGVFEGLAASGVECAFVHSTRSPVAGRKICAAFEESHSHASSHWIHEPEGSALAIARSAETLAVVDDEQSTGKTAAALASSLKSGLGLACRKVVVASYCDWISPADRAAAEATLSKDFDEVEWISLVRGEWSFEKDPSFEARLPEPPEGPEKKVPQGVAMGRLGLSRALEPKVCGESLGVAASRLIEAAQAKGRGSVLILGTGECAHAPFLLAKAIEEAGFPCRFQALTRSPILVGGAVERSMEVPSACGAQVRYYLHNGIPEAHLTAACFETDAGAEAWAAPFECEKLWFEEAR